MEYNILLSLFLIVECSATMFLLPGEGKWSEIKCLRKNLSELLNAFGLQGTPETYFLSSVSSYQIITKYSEYVQVNGVDPTGKLFLRKFQFEKPTIDYDEFPPFYFEKVVYKLVAEKRVLSIEIAKTGALRVTRTFLRQYGCLILQMAYSKVGTGVAGYFFYIKTNVCKLPCNSVITPKKLYLS